MSSRKRDNPKIDQQRTILRQWSASANQTIRATSAVLTWGLEGDAPLGGWNADGKGAAPVTRNATPLPKFCTPYIDPLNHIQIELLRRHRAGATDEQVVQGIHLSYQRHCCRPTQ